MTKKGTTSHHIWTYQNKTRAIFYHDLELNVTSKTALTIKVNLSYHRLHLIVVCLETEVDHDLTELPGSDFAIPVTVKQGKGYLQVCFFFFFFFFFLGGGAIIKRTNVSACNVFYIYILRGTKHCTLYKTYSKEFKNFTNVFVVSLLRRLG